MSEQPNPKRPTEREILAEKIDANARRLIQARRAPKEGVWVGLGMMGLVGWSVAVPTLLGAAIGVWIDQTYPGGRSWTLALLVAGLTLGCLNAWHWVAKQDQAIHEPSEGDHE